MPLNDSYNIAVQKLLSICPIYCTPNFCGFRRHTISALLTFYGLFSQMAYPLAYHIRARMLSTSTALRKLNATNRGATSIKVDNLREKPQRSMQVLMKEAGSSTIPLDVGLIEGDLDPYSL